MKPCQTAFDDFEELLTSNLLLMHYNLKVLIIVAADASSYAVGAVVLNKFPNGKEKTIISASRTLTRAEKRHDQVEYEALTVVFAAQRFYRIVNRTFYDGD